MRVGQRGVAKNRRNIPCMIHTLRLMTTMQLLYRMKITCSKGDYVLAAYDRICYIGNVSEDDVSDKALHIDLMVESGKVVKRFRWSKKQDTLWINSKYIIRKIQHPIATGKGGRLFRVSDDVMEFIETYNSN